MEFVFSRKTIKFERELSELDKFVLKITRIFNKQKIKYVVVSGYVPIVFGRSRQTEDIDILLEKLPFKKFLLLWKNLMKYFDCVNTTNAEMAYNEYLKNNTSIRFADKGFFIPNAELKFIKTDLDYYTLKNSTILILNNKKLFISPIELQIAYKIFLGSEKDFEDAKHLYNIFKKHIDIKKLKEFLYGLKINISVTKKYLGI